MCFRTYLHFRGVQGIVFMYDMTNSKSFDHIQNVLIAEAATHSPTAVKILVGNKSDLIDQKVVSAELAAKFAQEHQFSFMEISAKNSTNVHEMFRSLVARILAVDVEALSEKPAQECTCL
eukprot:TRINITY_DN5746_c0_g1_i1.p1 TRINITY_DN5746_c0_g1~~TRINITY_DN5746_c0_g1_i1.p1  ORF type:complete len:120 (+),score=29.26 TRINITY_DN5746_c0_g1_i1:294-653(+)